MLEMPGQSIYNRLGVCIQHRIFVEDSCANLLTDHRCKGALEIAWPTRLEGQQFHFQSLRGRLQLAPDPSATSSRNFCCDAQRPYCATVW